MIKKILMTSSVLLLTGCMSNAHMAPVETVGQPTLEAPAPIANVSPVAESKINLPEPMITRAKSHAYYIVKKGDTLYSIAWSIGVDYELLASINHIEAPYILSVGEKLKLPTAHQIKSTDKASKNIPSVADIQTIYWSMQHHKVLKEIDTKLTQELSNKKFTWKPKKYVPKAPATNRWQWPVKGKVVNQYSLSSGGNRGINITAYYKAPIEAAAAGKVVYAGNGVRGYGNMIIIENARHFLSAYAFNAVNLVHQGEWVKQGQRIALMGTNMAGQVMLHFEIRFYGKPVNPMRYLPKR